MITELHKVVRSRSCRTRKFPRCVFERFNDKVSELSIERFKDRRFIQHHTRELREVELLHNLVVRDYYLCIGRIATARKLNIRDVEFLRFLNCLRCNSERSKNQHATGNAMRPL